MGEAASDRRWGGKDATIAGLALLVVLLGGALAWEKGAVAGLFSGVGRGEAVSVFDVILDRQELSSIDLLFDRPLGEGREGEVLASPPATLSPAVGGVWRWRDASVLRFEPSGRLEMATEYTLALIPERLLGEGQRLTGPTTFSLRTDQFLVEGVSVGEEPAPTAGKGAVVLRGELRFNYPVDPEELAGRLRLADGGETVEVFYETSWPSPAVGFRTAPVVKRPAERELRLTIDRALTPAQGNVPLAAEYVHAIPLGSSERLAVRGVSTVPGERESALRIAFSSPVTAEAAGRYVSSEPAVTFRASAEGNEVVLTGGFVPGERYRVEVRAGLPASDGAVLAEAYRSEVGLPHLPPSVGFASEGMFLSASGLRSLALETVNVSRVELTVDRVYRNNLFLLFQYQSYLLGSETHRGAQVPHTLGDRIAEKTLRVRGQRNRRVVTPLALDELVSGREPGLYRVAVSRGEDWRAEQRWLLITDVGMVAKEGEGEVWAWLSSFADLSPVTGARVRLVSDQNQVLGEATSDAAGRVRFAGLGSGAGEPYLITAERGEEFSFLLLPQSGVDLSGLEVGGAPPRGEGYDAYLYGERDLYRPGETVEGLAVVRDRRVEPPPPMPVLLVHRDPQGQERSTQRLTTDRRGLAELRLELPPYARTGPHTLELKAGEEVIGSYRFQVEEFIPDRIKVEIEPAPGEAPGPGGELAFTVASDYLFGPPASGLAVTARVRLEPASFAPSGYDGYSFENPERSFPGLDVFTESGELDDAGRRAFRAGVPPGLAPPSSLEARVTARVQERGGRGVTALKRLEVHPFPHYVGVKREGDGYVEPGDEVAFRWVAVAPGAPGGTASPAAAGALRAELFQDRWNTLLRRTPDGGFRYESVRDPRLVDSRALPAGASEGSFAFTPPEFGAYRVVLTDLAANASAQVAFYASGWGYSPWAIESPGRVELDLDRETYRPGETATLQVRAPFAGKLLVTVEREGVLASELHTLDGNTATLTLPVREAYRPNVYVTATVVRAAGDLEPGSPGRAFGAIPLAVDRSDRRLPLEITAPAEMRPETTLEVAVQTAPGAAVTVAAVDEGILRLIGQATPDLFAHFYRKQALGVRSYDTFGLLFPELGVPPAGGGEGTARFAQYLSTEAMRRVEPVALWSGVLTADAAGRATARFAVGELQGQLRLMAVAIDGPRFASAEASVRVRDRVVALPTFPRFLQLGEHLELPVTVRNDTGRDGRFAVALSREGGGPGASTEVAVAEGAEATVYLPLEVPEEAGLARFTVTAQGNGESTRSRAALPVRPYLPARSERTAGALTGRETRLEGAPGELRPGTVSRELTIGPTPMVRLSGRLESLLAYPYGCLEQVVSRSFPLVYLADLARQLEPDLFAAAEPEVLVEEGVRRVSGLQLPTGGFAMWPDAPAAEPWVSLYATHFLVEAQRAGHYVDGSVLERALAYAGDSARAKVTYSQGELERLAYALYVLARAGRPDLGTMDFVRERHRGALGAESRALLAAAYAGLGNPQAAEELAAAIGEVERVERQTGGNLASTLRNRALLLLALQEAAPADPRIPQLAERLGREASASGEWTTQESAFAFLALGQLFRQQAERPPYAGAVFLGDREVGRFGAETVSFADLPGGAPLSIVLDPGYEAGSAFYSLTTRGVPTDAAFRPRASGLEVERSFLGRDGRPADLAALLQGDLVVMRTRVRSVAGPVDNVVVASLLPPGLEVENPRLRSAETLPWITDATLDPAELDLRDDRVLAFTDLPANQWQTLYTLLRAVVPGTYRLPPLHAEAMYDPALTATGPAGEVRIGVHR